MICLRRGEGAPSCQPPLRVPRGLSGPASPQTRFMASSGVVPPRKRTAWRARAHRGRRATPHENGQTHFFRSLINFRLCLRHGDAWLGSRWRPCAGWRRLLGNLKTCLKKFRKFLKISAWQGRGSPRHRPAARLCRSSIRRSALFPCGARCSSPSFLPP